MITKARGILAKSRKTGTFLTNEMQMSPKMLAEALHLLLQLGYVDLSSNTLEGSLPQTWGNLTNVSLKLVIALMSCYKCMQLVF